MAKDLATIIRDVPGIQLDLTRAQLGDFDRQRVVGLFHELGFRRMLDDIARSMDHGTLDGPGASGQLALFAEAAAEDTADSGAASGGEAGTPQEGDGIVRDLAELDAVVEKLKTAKAIAFNVQTTGLAADARRHRRRRPRDRPGRRLVHPRRPRRRGAAPAA